MATKPNARSAAELEAIGLCVCCEALDDIVNRGLLEMIEVSQRPGECETRFHTRYHQLLFLIRLLDFAKESGDSSLTGVKGSCIEVLGTAAIQRALHPAGDSAPLAAAVTNLRDWLEREREVKMWLPTLNIDAQIKLPCMDLLHIAGNQSKHNLSRLTGVCGRIATTLQKQNYAVSAEMIPLALDEFHEHLVENFFCYYGTWLAELLNEVRWGIYSYLKPQFDWSYQKQGDGLYSFRYPAEVQDDVVRQWYWRLMNIMRHEPIFKRFTCGQSLRSQSSLEWINGAP